MLPISIMTNLEESYLSLRPLFLIAAEGAGGFRV